MYCQRMLLQIIPFIVVWNMSENTTDVKFNSLVTVRLMQYFYVPGFFEILDCFTSSDLKYLVKYL